MAKKKKSALPFSEEQQLEALQSIVQMSPEQQEGLLAIAEEFEKMPKAFQNQMLDFFQKLSEMPEEEQECILSEMEDDLDKDSGCPYILPRTNVKKFTLRVTLRGLKPAIFRKFNVPSNITLRHLSALLLDLMGWENEHLNQFRKGDDYYAPAYQCEHELSPLFAMVPERLEWYEMDMDFDPDYFNTDFAYLICEDYCE